tara:strand:- start:15336 stop:15689 length:354 start_codon:yes stop_codon:yes gene_type:complete
MRALIGIKDKGHAEVAQGFDWLFNGSLEQSLQRQFKMQPTCRDVGVLQGSCHMIYKRSCFKLVWRDIYREPRQCRAGKSGRDRIILGLRSVVDGRHVDRERNETIARLGLLVAVKFR